jgi:CRP/FNR family transcriptional regulator, cyclic AMP receptor protein
MEHCSSESWVSGEPESEIVMNRSGLSSNFMGLMFRDGHAIVRQGELGDCMYVIQEGQVEVIYRKGEKEFCLGVLGPGDFFGETALIEQEVRPATVRALGAVIVLRVEKRTFLQRVHEDASFAFRIIKKMARQIRELENALVRTSDIPSTEASKPNTPAEVGTYSP